MQLDAPDVVKNWPEIILGVGALGTASFALVDASRAILPDGGASSFGYPYLEEVYECLAPALAISAGQEWRNVLKGYWVSGTTKDQQIATVISLLRLGLNEDNVVEIMDALLNAKSISADIRRGLWSGLGAFTPWAIRSRLRSRHERRTTRDYPIDPKALIAGAQYLQSGAADEEGPQPTPPQPPAAAAASTSGRTRRPTKQDDDDAARAQKARKALDALGRFDAIVRTRLDSAFELADHAYRSQAKIYSGGVAVLLSFAAGYIYSTEDPKHVFPWFAVVVIGVLAVPLAPMSKDLASALKTASDALKKTVSV